MLVRARKAVPAAGADPLGQAGQRRYLSQRASSLLAGFLLLLLAGGCTHLLLGSTPLRTDKELTRSHAVDQTMTEPQLAIHAEQESDSRQSHPRRTEEEPQPWLGPYLADIDTPRLSDAEMSRYQGYGLYSLALHTGPIADLKDFLAPRFGIQFTDYAYHDQCKFVGNCAADQGLKVITWQDMYSLGACPGITKRRFFYTYHDYVQENVDAFICFHPVAICEAFMAFNKSIIVMPTTRFELGRLQDLACMAKLVENLRRIAADPRNIIAANNMYDIHYLHYFTGIKNIQLLPSYCGHTKATYQPTSMDRLLIGLNRDKTSPGLFKPLQKLWASGKTKRTFTIHSKQSLGKRYLYKDLASFTAVIVIPYQLSIMSAFEYYRMGLPLLIPSLDLLYSWHMEWRCVRERTWDGAWKNIFPHKSSFPRHPEAEVLDGWDPNNEHNGTVVRRWLSLADWYHWPHVILFDSWEDLASKLDTVDFLDISKKMMAYNDRLRRQLERIWLNNFDRMWGDIGGPGGRKVADDYDLAMSQLYGIPPPDDPCEECESDPKLNAQQANLRRAWANEDPNRKDPLKSDKPVEVQEDLRSASAKEIPNQADTYLLPSKGYRRSNRARLAVHWWRG